CMIVFGAVLTPLLLFSKPLLNANSTLFAGTLIGLGALYTIAIFSLGLWTRREHRRVLSLEPFRDNDAAAPVSPQFIEYRSSRKLLGLPLYHIRMGGSLAETRRSVKAWIAVGDSACGVL